MAKDDRLFAKFTLDFADSPKIAPLNDKAFRQYVEAVLWSRRLLTDGLIPQGMVQRMFAPESLAALTSNDPERPSLRQTDGGYEIHDFLESQTSKAEIEAMRERKIEAGRAGGYAKAKAKQTPTSGLAGASKVPADSGCETPSKTYPETETETETKNKNSVQATPSRMLESEFAEWWKVYPRKQAKPDALKAFKAARKTTDLDTLTKGAQAYALLNLGGDRSKVKMPAGWLRSERWADEDQIPSEDHTPPWMKQDAPIVHHMATPAECTLHRGYPVPCDRCARDRDEGREF